MLQNFDSSFDYPMLTYLVGSADIVKKMSTVRSMRPFSDDVIDFLNSLSKKLLKTGKEYSDVVTFAFWCRKAALLAEKNKYDDISQRLGKGVIFHSTPSNVPVNFAFSFATGLIAGNANVVRLPAKSFEQVNIICDAVNDLVLGEHINIAPYIAMVKYPPSKDITDAFSMLCDTRVVWGGDGTINEMRQSSIKPRANEITFADRHSIAIINADEYLNAENKDKIAQDFYNDTYFSDQNACTAPRIIIWHSKSGQYEAAKSIFWKYIHDLAVKKYEFAPVQSVGKLAAFYKVASRFDVKLIADKSYSDNFITRIKVDTLSENLMKYKYNSGFFFEYDTADLNEIFPICSERCQTMSYYGFTQIELNEFIDTSRPKGIDRIVPIGKTMDFMFVWDGHDLVREMSRRISTGH